MARLTDTPAWRALESHYEKVKGVELRQLFAEDSRRGETFVAEGAGRFTPSGGPHAELFAEQRDEDLRLRLAKSRQRRNPLEQFGAR